MTRRFWTQEELDAVQRRYGREPAAAIARSLRRSIRSVYQAADKAGLTAPKANYLKPEVAGVIRDKHAAGWTDGELAPLLNINRRTVTELRRRLGLSCNRDSQRYRERVAQATRRQCEKAGVASLAELKSTVVRERALAAGWPADLRPREVAILNSFWDRGPMTRRELCEAIGGNWIGSRASLKCGGAGGSYLACLMRRGLVVCFQKIVKGRGKGRNVNVYSLPLWIERGAVQQESQHAPN